MRKKDSSYAGAVPCLGQWTSLAVEGQLWEVACPEEHQKEPLGQTASYSAPVLNHQQHPMEEH